MMKILLYWLEQGADGFRIDAINHMFETKNLPNETYIDENGDKTVYDNLYHNHTMNLVRFNLFQFLYTSLKIFFANSLNHMISFTMFEK